MNVRPYEPKDFEQIKSWGEKWGADYQEDQFPKHGFIVDDVCAYFIYSTDSSVCFLENLVRNPNADIGDKFDALGHVIEACFAKAHELGFKIAYATTDNISAARRARSHGALARPYNFLLTKNLTTKL